MAVRSDRDLRTAGIVVQCLNQAIVSGEGGIAEVPGLVIRVIDAGLWAERIEPNSGWSFSFETFEEFVEAKPPGGLYVSMRMLKNLCRDDRRALAKIEHVTQRTRADNKLVDNVHKRPAGNSAMRGLRRLRTQRPDLHQRVLDGELSVHAAMIEAGFRKPKMTVPVDSPEAAIRALLRRFTADDLRDALDG
jgi:CRP-like cAMP-binding protein